MRAALVPVKHLGRGKSRLASRLDRGAVEKLTLAMLEDILEALRGADSFDVIAVVTPDAAVARAAEGFGARALKLPEPGLNPSLDAGAERLAAEGAESLLVTLGDVAGALAEDVSELLDALEALGGRGAVLAPARDGGTGALLRAPHDVIPSRFGPESAEAHRDLAHAAGVPFRELALPSLSLDLDTREDLASFVASARGGRRTRALLRDLAPELGP